MSRAHRLGLLTFAVVPLLAACGFEEPAIPVVTREALTRVHVPPIEGRTGVMDAMVVDPETHLLYVADGTSPDHPGVDVVDIGASSAAYRATIATGDAPPNGLALVPERCSTSASSTRTSCCASTRAPTRWSSACPSPSPASPTASRSTPGRTRG